jgi:hypothetical protein
MEWFESLLRSRGVRDPQAEIMQYGWVSVWLAVMLVVAWTFIGR